MRILLTLFISFACSLARAQTPVPEVVQISGAEASTCFLFSDGQAGCLKGSTNRTYDPKKVNGNWFFHINLPTQEKITSLSISNSYGCAISASAKLFCWGGARDGNLISSLSNFYVEPRVLPGLENINAVQVRTADTFACVLTDDARVACWGRAPSDYTSVKFVEFADDIKIKSIAVGNGYACALATDDQIHCWATAVRLDGVAPFIKAPHIDGYRPVEIMASNRHMCATFEPLTGSHPMYRRLLECWGSNDYFVAGTGARSGMIEKPEPAILPSGVFPEQVTLGQNNTCVSTNLGHLFYCWGGNFSQQIEKSNRNYVGTTVDQMTNLESLDLGTSLRVRSSFLTVDTFWILLEDGSVRVRGRPQMASFMTSLFKDVEVTPNYQAFYATVNFERFFEPAEPNTGVDN